MKKKKHILHLSHTDIRFDSRILKELQALLNLPNCEIMAFGVLDDNEQKQYKGNESLNIKTFKISSKKWRSLPRPIRYFCNYVEAMFTILRPSILLKPDIVHCHDTLFLPLAFIIKIICGSKLIYDAHELESNKNAQSKLLSWGTLFIEKIAWHRINLLIAVSPSIIDWYNKKFGFKENLLILNSPVYKSDKGINSQYENYLRNTFSIPSDKKIFLYLGIIGKGRGVDIYLDVFTRNNINSHVVFMGYGEYVEKIQDIATKFNNIHFHPSVSHDKVVNIARSADIGLSLIEAVSLSDYYCLPNKLFEYAFAGLYVLASDFPDMRDLVSKYSLGVCSSLEPDEVFKAVKQLENMHLQKFEKDFYPISWAYQAEKLLLEYMKLLKL